MDIKYVVSAIKEVYTKFQDDLSRQIFVNCLRYHFDGDKNHLYNMLCESGLLETGLDEQVKTIGDLPGNQEVILYGCAGRGSDVYHLMLKMGNRVKCFCDDDPSKQKSGFCGLPVISANELMAKHKESLIVVSTLAFKDKVYNFLIKNGFPKENIFVSHALAPQYFGLDFLKPLPEEVFIDAGCMDGETLIQFRDWCNGQYKTIYGLEPDTTNYHSALETIKYNNIERVSMVNKGAWCRNDALFFSATANGSSNLSESGSVKVDVAPIDDIVGDDKVTYLKMDIEGAELNALIGAKNTITKNKPRLAICVYHKPEDILEIPLYLLQLVPSYKFYLRHHSQFYIETVLYATI